VIQGNLLYNIYSRF